MSDYRDLTHRLEAVERQLAFTNRLLEEGNADGFFALQGEVNEYAREHNTLSLPDRDEHVRCVASLITSTEHPLDELSVVGDQLRRVQSYPELRLAAA